MTGETRIDLPGQRAALLDAMSAETLREVRAVQLQRALSHVPMLYAVGVFNLALVAILCWHQGLPVASYAWMGLVAVAGLWRMLTWHRRSRTPSTIAKPEGLLRGMTVIAIATIGSLSAWTVYALWTGLVDDMLLVPVSLVFGATCIGHCLAPVKRAAIGSIVVGVFPPAIVMLLSGDFRTALLGASMVTIALLMIVFLVESYHRIVSGIVLEQEIKRLALTDSLTGIANRHSVMERLAEADAISGGGYALVMLDLDGFKSVNDRFGHPAGDALLQTVAERLRGAARPNELVGRMGGDEFVVLLPGMLDREEAELRVRAFRAAMCRAAAIDGHPVPVSGSFGCALCPRDGKTAEEIMIAADAALYAAKRVTQGERRTAMRSAA